ncbi:MAG: VirB3 family type IV secretion system protein [Burkholderia sp.]
MESTATEQRKIPLHQSLARVILVGGAGRKETAVLAIVCVALIFGLRSLEGIGLGIVLAFLGMWGLRKLATIDPQFIDVMKRHTSYQDYYPAQSYHTSKTPPIKG